MRNIKYYQRKGKKIMDNIITTQKSETLTSMEVAEMIEKNTNIL